jgi:hypothetical protein
MKRNSTRKARIGVETLEGRALLSGVHHLHHRHHHTAPPAVIQQPNYPSIIGDQFAITDGGYKYIGRLTVTYENVNTGGFRGTYVDREFNRLGVVMSVSGRLVRDSGMYVMSFSGSGSATRKEGGVIPLYASETQNVTFGGSLNLSNFSLPMVGILDVHDTYSFLFTTNSDTGEISVGGRLPKPVPDVSGQTFTIDDASFHKIGTLVISTEDQSSDTFTGYYIDGLHNELGVVQTIHGVIVANPDSHGPVGFLFAGSGSVSRVVPGGILPLVYTEHQFVNFDYGTIEGSGFSATISGMLELTDDYSSFGIDTTYDSGQMQVTGIS